MRKSFIVIAIIISGACIFCGASYAWQGRMAGMGDPYGLVEDESDFLINPAKIADGQGIRHYGNYRFTYTDTLEWKIRTRGVTLPPSSTSANATGDEYRHDVLLGAGIPAGAGRLGFFFGYSGKRSDFDVNTRTPSIGIGFNSDMTSDFDDFALRMLYGQALSNDLKIGAGIQLAYRTENNHYSTSAVGVASGFFGINDFSGNLMQFMLPYDSQYWEVLVNTGLEKDFGAFKTGVTIRGGSIFAGDNGWSNRSTIAFSNTNTGFNIGGDTDGWKIGGDLWLRYYYSQSLSFPFLVRLDYSEKSRSGAGIASGWLNLLNPPFFPFPIFVGTEEDQNLAYDMQQDLLRIEAGGGFDLALNDSARIAAGLYYNYISAKNDFAVRSSFLTPPAESIVFRYSGFPEVTEHLVRFKLAGEMKLNPQWTLNGGLDAFGGFAREDYGSRIADDAVLLSSYRASLDGTHWGITGYMGVTTQCMGLTIQPFLQAGYQELSLEDSSARSNFFNIPLAWDSQKDKREVLVGAGFSILF